MGFWNKLGQVALQAAPYVAAPFTGGLSLMAAPATGQLANKLEDRADRETFEKTGIAPSRNMMNKIMGGVNTAAGMYGGAKLGGKLGGGGASTPPINPVKPAGGGLMDFGKSFMNQQLGGGGGALSGIFGGSNSGASQGQPQPQAGPIALPSTRGAEQPVNNLSATIASGRQQARRGIGPSRY